MESYTEQDSKHKTITVRRGSKEITYGSSGPFIVTDYGTSALFNKESLVDVVVDRFPFLKPQVAACRKLWSRWIFKVLRLGSRWVI